MDRLTDLVAEQLKLLESAQSMKAQVESSKARGSSREVIEWFEESLQLTRKQLAKVDERRQSLQRAMLFMGTLSEETAERIDRGFAAYEEA